MKKEYFDFDSWRERIGLKELPAHALCDMFLVDHKKGQVMLSFNLAKLFGKDAALAPSQISVELMADRCTPESRDIFLQDLARLREGRTAKTDSHLNMRLEGKYANLLVIMLSVAGNEMALGMCHVNFDLMHEHDMELEQAITKLEEAQCINQLILEGSTDYIYQLDLIRNECTFSPKAMDVLPLESPTFGNAMDRLLGFIVPEDRRVFLESFTPFLTGKSRYHTAEYRVNTKQGKVIWISCHGKGIHDSCGRPLMIAGSLMDVTSQKEAEERIRSMLYYDMMTGLKNRHCFDKELTEYLQEDPGAEGSVLCIDIHNFKVFNEIFGHNFGNKILKEFARILSLYISDNLGIYRMDGDEFLIHLRENEPEEILDKLAPFQMYLNQPRVLEGHTIYIRANVGVAIYPTHGATSEELLKNAETAMLMHAKSDSQQTVFFRSETSDILSKRYLLENELRNDIAAGMRNFRLVYQPVVEMEGEGGEPFWHGAEALLRYRNEALPDVTQKDLIETLEYSDMIIPVGRWVLDTAIRECARWHKMGHPAYINVNIAAQQVSDDGLVLHIQDCCKKCGLDPKWLVCELTETSLINNLEIANQFCVDLMNIGAGVALDDFGTGYSSFNYLRRLPISQIKVDRDYVQHLSTDPYNQIILRCLFDLGQTLGLQLCVEGVETENTMDLLRQMGIRLMQGFLFDRPLEVDVFRKELLNHHAPA